MGLFSNKNKRDSAAQDGDRFYSKDDDAAIGERARAKRASHAGATANGANGGASARRSANDPLLPEKKRARRRLVGAVALALAAAVGLPMLLDSAPKPLAGDIAIQIPSKDKAAPLPVPAAPGASSDTAASSADADDAPAAAEQSADKPAGKSAAKAVAPAAAVSARPKTVAAADSVDQGEEVIAPPKPAARKPDPKLEARSAADTPKPEHKDTRAVEKAERERAQKAEHDRVEKAEHDRAERVERADRERKAREAKDAERLARAREKEKAVAEDHPKAVPDKPARHDDASRAMAILEGKGAAAGADAKHDTRHDEARDGAPAPKSTIQVAAMSSQDKAAELQARLSAAGISSYTEKAANGLIRVKIGPLAHDDADRVRAKLGKLGL